MSIQTLSSSMQILLRTSSSNQPVQGQAGLVNNQQLSATASASDFDTPNPLDIKKQVEQIVSGSKELKLLQSFMSEQQKAAIKEQPITKAQSNESPLSLSNQPSQQYAAQLEQASAASIKQQSTTEATLEINSNNGPVNKADPLAFDLDHNGFTTSGINHGAHFDLNADGKLDRISNLTGKDAFLALDKNGNSRIDDGRELFGDQNGAAHGFAELAKYDSNLDQIIDEQDAVYQQLQLVRFDGSKQHIQPLSQTGIKAISLAYKTGYQGLSHGDSLHESSTATQQDGANVAVADLQLTYR